MIKALVIGSVAMNMERKVRDPRDIDLVMTWEDYCEFAKRDDVKMFPSSGKKSTGRWADRIVEVDIAWPGSTDALLLSLAEGVTGEMDGIQVKFANKDWMYALKMSHRFRKNSPHFEKTMMDIKFLRSLGAEIPNQDWYNRREKETLAVHPKLNQSKKDFFDTPGIEYQYDHDSLHRAISYPNEPAYTTYMKDGAEVMCDKGKWDAAPFQVKVNGVLEECLVLALERSQIPFGFGPDKDASFKMALFKVCTSITSGWFREWAWEHYDHVLRAYKLRQERKCYIEIFRDGLERGTVQAAEGFDEESLDDLGATEHDDDDWTPSDEEWESSDC